MPGRRALSRSDFSLISGDRSSKRAASTHFSVTYSSQGSGLAVVVSKKVAKSAVERHLIKRRIREAAHAVANREAVVQSYGALIIYARTGVGARPFAEIQAELTPLLEQLLPLRTI